MKSAVLVCLIVLFLPAVYAQKKGVIRYAVTVEKRDTSVDAIMSAALLKKSDFTFTFKKKRRERVQLKAGTFFEFVTIFDYKKGKFLRLTDDQKKKVANEGEIFVAQDSVYYAKSIYKLLEDTMMILGYKCYKAVAETRSGQLICWYTKEIKHDFKRVDFLQIDVPGMPLSFMSNSGKVMMTFNAVAVDKLKREDRKALRYKIPEDYILGPSTKKQN